MAIALHPGLFLLIFHVKSFIKKQIEIEVLGFGSKSASGGKLGWSGRHLIARSVGGFFMVG